jgi:hypothetical protein
MKVRDTLRHFIFTLLKSINPRYYLDLAEKTPKQAFKYFLALLLFSFIFMSIIAIPKLIIIKSDLERDALHISKFHLSADLETVRPINIPKSRPIISIDTTENETLDQEAVLITDEKIFYQALGMQDEMELKKFDFNEDKAQSSRMIIRLLIFILPSIFAFYYMVYMIKYLTIILFLGIAAFLLSKLFKSRVTFSQTISLSFYTSTIMILLEILMIPFFL